VPKVDFSKELLLVGTWRGTNFKFLGDVKGGNLTVELVGDKAVEPGFRFKVISLPRKGITKFQGKELPPAERSEVQPIEEKNVGELTGTVSDRGLLKSAPPSRVITTQKEWDVIVKDWNVKNPPPVDFTRDIVVVGTTTADSLTIAPTVKDGNLTVAVTEGKGTGDGFRYRFVTVRRAGIKTINGRPLPPPARPANPPPTPGAGLLVLDLAGEVNNRNPKLPAFGTVISSQKEWDKLVEDWNIKDAPRVDFTRNVLVAAATDTDSMTIRSELKDGDLRIATTPGKVKRDGFRWRVISVPRAGITSVNGQPLPRP
jgi:hypothetical protein